MNFAEHKHWTSIQATDIRLIPPSKKTSQAITKCLYDSSLIWEHEQAEDNFFLLKRDELRSTGFVKLCQIFLNFDNRRLRVPKITLLELNVDELQFPDV